MSANSVRASGRLTGTKKIWCNRPGNQAGAKNPNETTSVGLFPACDSVDGL